MPLGISLSQFEKGQILAFRTSGKSMNYISKELNRSRCVIQNFLRHPILYGEKNEKVVEDCLLTARNDKSLSIRRIRLSCKQIKENCNLSVSPSTILRAIKRSPNMIHSKMVKAPSLENVHKVARMNFARNNMDRAWNLVSYTFN